MAISDNIEFFTQEAIIAEPNIGSLLTMFVNSTGSLGIGELVTFDVNASDVFLLRGPQIKEGNLVEDRLLKTTSYTLNTTTSIDFTSTGTTAIYTTPTDKTALILGVILQVTAANAVTITPEISIGLNPSTDNVFATEPLINFNSVDELYYFWANVHKAVILPSGGVLDLDVATAATATSLIATSRVVGIQI